MAGELRIGGQTPLRPLDAERAASWLADLRKAATEAGLVDFAGFLEAPSADRERIGAVLDLSPFLGGTMLRRPHWPARLLTEDAGERVRAIVEALRAPLEPGGSESALMSELREAKAEAALLIALRDLFGAADAARTTADLSDLAEACVARALRFCLLDLHSKGQLVLPDPGNPEKGCGLFVLGMGKLGGRELNYSSDIDLILFFDPDAPAIVDVAESVETFSRVARRLVRMIGERTRDGYVFRTDLRLRPDPSAMPLAIPLPTALVYYESSGRDWERVALIKARSIAGDRAASREFRAAISPFVWRRYLDFAALRGIEAMKERMDRHRGFDRIAVPGHDVKLGRGGIREVEFFAQTQQLIAGGRAPQLRTRRTDKALRRLAEGGWIDAGMARELTESYWFLRRVEHAVQMVADEQTHTLPETEEELLRIARLLGIDTVDAFSDMLLGHLRRVKTRFSGLFARSGERKSAEAEAPVLDALSDEEDAEALEWLTAQGFGRPQDVARLIAGWGASRHRALRSEGAREHLRAVLPSLVSAFAGARDPDAAIVSFDRFLAGLPSGLQFFALIASNPKLLELLATIITSAPGLAETIAQRPHVFDALLDPAFYGELPDPAALAERLDVFMTEAGSHEEELDRLRAFASEQRFLIGVRLLSGAVTGEEAGVAFSDLAEAILAALLKAVTREFAMRHGHVAGGRVALHGLGRLGSRELTATSDVDLILFYDHDEGAEDSDGERPLPVSTYYTRLTQRLISGLTAPMRDGILYEVDFRLRPSGNKGPLATQVDAFRRYQEKEAWTWERMALTRSRPIGGDAALMEEVAQVVRAVVSAPREPSEVAADAATMRARIERDKPGRGALDLKLRPGGLVDLEFIAQWAILIGLVPAEFVGRPTAEVLEALEEKQAGGPCLAPAMRAFTRVIQLIRLGRDGVHDVAALPRGLAERVARSIGVDDVAAIEPELDRLAGAVRERFEALLPLQTED
ncbi:bifunctional [glutamine synthetase] adenylyltransferase/[glutamine synthetase]-adenylyl-L-tyrosine phosphorylase [Aureimonas mangrovi]|uniref:bifunctional [glutamine synthetase] adenylyltransferase/[glutamine synthetase]-adenylyl-L-tyrosine phosphorylase n=1 Tax=Aureimonas mangrovi TaxID=2758041 RepID=UPI00163D58D1|nr:bifunctional [glutamine synthetase] adenylyltransferase/[glutamine synthetase]-adenylyl-L-tyrosine phosphorylase [Aureimonas mangrovi]